MRSGKLIILIYFFSMSFCSSAQKLDSLKRQLESYEKEDTIKLRLWMGIANEYYNVNPDKSLEAADSAIVLAKQLKSFAWLANAYNIRGANLINKGEISLALTWFQKALSAAEESGNKRRIWQTVNNIGAASVKAGNYANAIVFFQRALSIATELKQNDGIASTLSNISAAYKQLSDYPKTLEYALKALKIAEQIGLKKSIQSSLNNIGGVYVGLNDFYKADEYYKRALSISEEINDKRGMAIYLNNLGDVSGKLSKYSASLEYRLKALNISEQAGFNDLIMLSLANAASDYMYLSNFPKAFEYSERALNMRERMGEEGTAGFPLINLGRLYANAPDSILAKNGFDSLRRYNKSLELLNAGLKIATETNNLEWQRNAWEDISKVYQKQNDYPKALSAFEKFVTIRDSMVNSEKEKKITRLTLQYEFEKKADSFKIQKLVTSDRIKQQVLLAKQQQQQLELNKKELELRNKEKDLQKLAYLKTQADLQNEQLLKQEKERQLTISEKEK